MKESKNPVEYNGDLRTEGEIAGFAARFPDAHAVMIGRGAVAGIVSGLQEKYTVLDEPPLHGKDVNDELKIRVGIMREREEIER